MSNISPNTYSRTFAAANNIKDAAGNYENTIKMKMAKAVVGILTLGIGYGVMRLIKEFAFVRPKIQEFCNNAGSIFEALDSPKNKGKKVIAVELDNNLRITLEEIEGGVKFTDEQGNTSTCFGETFETIKDKILKDSNENSAFYVKEFAFVIPKIPAFHKNAGSIFEALDHPKNKGNKEITVELYDDLRITLEEIEGVVKFTDEQGNTSTCLGETFETIKNKILKDSIENSAFYEEAFTPNSQEENYCYSLINKVTTSAAQGNESAEIDADYLMNGLVKQIHDNVECQKKLRQIFPNVAQKQGVGDEIDHQAIMDDIDKLVNQEHRIQEQGMWVTNVAMGFAMSLKEGTPRDELQSGAVLGVEVQE